MVASLLDLKTPAELMEADWELYLEAPLEWRHVQHVAGLFSNYWQCDPNDPPEFHAEWSSGLCSADFFNLADTLKACQPFCAILGYNAIDRFNLECASGFKEVVGSATGSTALAKSIAYLNGVRHLLMEKPAGTKDQLWPDDQPLLDSDNLVGHFEELTSTLSTPPRVREAIRLRHSGVCAVNFAPVLIVAVDRRSVEEQAADLHPIVDGSRMVAAFSFPSTLYQPGAETCPMCAKGSTPIRPRGNDGANWAKLTHCVT